MGEKGRYRERSNCLSRHFAAETQFVRLEHGVIALQQALCGRAATNR
jgi:hypothetical protein